MFNKFTLAAAVGIAAIAAIPAAAEARPHGYYDQGSYGRSYDSNYYGNSGYYNRGYANQGYNNGYYDRGYANSGYNNGYYAGRGNRHYYGRRCSGTTGTIVGAAGGALLGRSLDGPRGGRATGTILGGVLGALAGRSIDKDSCRR